jgi:drug/metabolite transporter (DMT)-like permease
MTQKNLPQVQQPPAGTALPQERPSGTGLSWLLPPLAAALASAFFGAAVVATRFAVHDVDPLLVAFLRYFIATLCLAPLLIRAGTIPRGGDLWRTAGLGLVFFGLFPWFFSSGLHYIPASRAALWLAVMPLSTFALSLAMRYEQLAMRKLVGVVIATIGAVLALRQKAAIVSGSDEYWIGDLLLAATACCGTIYFVLSRPVLSRQPALSVTGVAMAFGSGFLAILSLAGGRFAQLGSLPRASWYAIIFLGTLGAAAAFLMWTWALKRSTPTRTAIFLMINPLVAISLGTWLLDEAVTPGFLAGAACVLIGAAVVNLPAKRRPA